MRKTVFRVLAVGLAILAGLGLAELGLRFGSWFGGSRAQRDDPRQACDFLFRPSVWSQEIDGRVHIAHAQLEAFCSDFEFDAKHNSHGFRSPEYTVAHPPRTFRLSVIGDSITWGQGVAFDALFTNVLAEEHRKRCPAGGPALEVLNHGIHGSTLLDNYVRLRAHVEALRPDLVVFQFTFNDLFSRRAVEFLPSLTRQDLAYRQPERWVLAATPFKRMTPLSPWLMLEFRRAYAEGSPEWDRFEATLDRIREWTLQTATPIYFLVFPITPEEPWSDRPDDVLRRLSARLTESATAEMRERGFGALDLIGTFDRRGRGEKLRVSKQDGHPNARAHRLAAEALYEVLLREGLLGCPLPEGRDADPRWEEEREPRMKASQRWESYNRSYDEQLQLFEELRQVHPENLWLGEQVAFVHHRLARQGPQLYRELAELARAAGRQAVPWQYLGYADPQDEARHAVRLLEIAPDYPPAIETLSRSRFADGRRREGCELLERLLNEAAYLDQAKRALAWNRQHRCGEPRPVFDPVRGGTIRLGR